MSWFRSWLKGRIKRQRGQGMTEYIIIVGLVGILLAGTVWTFKEQIRVTIVGGKAKAEKWSSDMDNDDPAVPDPVDPVDPNDPGGFDPNNPVDPGN